MASSTDTDLEAPAGSATRTFRIGQASFPARPIDSALYLVATPIGNLGDISLRALETLAAADVLACEDTRVTRVLLTRYGIARRPYPYHEHNAEAAGAKLIEALERGQSVALVSDAGTPLVSDPGYRLVEAAIAGGHRVVPIPGASAPLAALAASGLPTDSFFFAGFLPQRQKARRDRLGELAQLPATLIFFESPHRLPDAIADCAAIFGKERHAAVCRELTKLYEETRRGPLGELAAFYADGGSVKGEIVILVAPHVAAPGNAEDAEALLVQLVADISPAQAATEAAKLTGLPRKALYQRLLALKDRRP